jgi:hypothetical protein
MEKFLGNYKSMIFMPISNWHVSCGYVSCSRHIPDVFDEGEVEMTKYAWIAIAILTTRFAVPAAATVVNFEDVPNYTLSTSLNSDGYHFSANNNGAFYQTDGIDCTPACVSDGSRTLLAGGVDFGMSTQVTMTRAGGGEFDVTSLSVGGVFTDDDPEFDAGQVDYTEMLNNTVEYSGVIHLTHDANGVANYTNVTIHNALVTEIIFTGVGGAIGNNGFGLDNINVTNVPEPGSLLLMGMGLLALTPVLRRRALTVRR